MSDHADTSMVLYALIRRNDAAAPQFLVRRTHGAFTFPPTKMREGQDLYDALDRVMEDDLGLARKSFYPEAELGVVERAEDSPEYEGLSGTWYLYPVAVSITPEALTPLLQYSRTFPLRSSSYEGQSGSAANSGCTAPAVPLGKYSRACGPAAHERATPPDLAWLTLDELEAATQEPNTLAIIQFLRTDGADKLKKAPLIPSMDALACYWSRFHDGGVRIARGETLKKILLTGNRAFNLRVADPYLPYQKQGLGFTWSFFSPKDKQDLHVHGMPAVEIYGVMEGRLQLWWKPMNARGVQVWKNQILEAGDWAEVDPLNCHFAAWLTPEGIGTVIKAAGTGELAGVGRLGVSGKTVCHRKNPDGTVLNCQNHGHCQIPPALQTLMAEFQKEFEERDWDHLGEVR